MMPALQTFPCTHTLVHTCAVRRDDTRTHLHCLKYEHLAPNAFLLRRIRALALRCRPGHAASWCTGYPDVCPSPTCNQPLNVASDKTFTLIEARDPPLSPPLSLSGSTMHRWRETTHFFLQSRCGLCSAIGCTSTLTLIASFLPDARLHFPSSGDAE